MTTRKQNEREFHNWEELADGGRRYWRERAGGDFGYCRYIKWVDQNEIALLFIQEIYDDDGKLIETHQKFPVDTGHRIIEGDNDDLT